MDTGSEVISKFYYVFFLLLLLPLLSTSCFLMFSISMLFCRALYFLNVKILSEFYLDFILGDASSPHGSNCLQFNGNGVSGDGSKSSSPSLPAAAVNDGLSRQQLDLISQIMQQTKPNVSLTSTHLQNGQKSIPRPRTWNIQVSL